MISRRTLLAGSAALAAQSATRFGAAFAEARFATKLPIPELIDASARNHAISLTAQVGKHEFWPGRPATALGYSANYLGPTLRLRRGEEIQFDIGNKIGEPTTVHWHGMIVPGAVDGGPHNAIAPGGRWRPTLKVDQPAATVWYHAHPHGATAVQVYWGLAGLIMIDDGSDARLGLPSSYGVDDLPLVLQDRAFNEDGSLAYDRSPMAAMMGMIGDTIIVNGVVAPVARVPKGLVRLRMLNGSNARFLRLAFADGGAFFVIASDSGLLAAPVERRDLIVSPGERYEILVDFADGKSRVLESLPHDIGANSGMPGMMRMMRASPDQPEQIARFEPDAALAANAREIPKALGGVAAPDPSSATVRRRLTLEPTMGGMGMMGMMGGGRRGSRMGISGKSFAMDRIDFEAKLGSVEIWEVQSQMMAHPFHVHGTAFRILSIDGAPPPAHLAGPKDMALIENKVELLVPFNALATKDNPYMFHCHILEHEDAGMMGQFAVT